MSRFAAIFFLILLAVPGAAGFASAHCVCVALCLSLLAMPGRADEPRPPEFVGIRVGLADCYKVGLWTPVELTLRGGSEPLAGQIRVTAPDDDGIACLTSTQDEACRLTPDHETKTTVYVRFGQSGGSIEAVLVVGDRTVASKRFATPSISPRPWGR